MIDKIANFLEREGGHISVACALLFFGSIGAVYKIAKADDIAIFALGVLATVMKGNGNGRHMQPEPGAPTATVTLPASQVASMHSGQPEREPQDA